MEFSFIAKPDNAQRTDPTQFWAHGKYHTFSPKSMWLFSNTNSFRKAVVYIITHKRFDHVIVLLILINSLLLGAKDYTDINQET